MSINSQRERQHPGVDGAGLSPSLSPRQQHEPHTEKKKKMENRKREKNQLLCNTLKPQIAHSEPTHTAQTYVI